MFETQLEPCLHAITEPAAHSNNMKVQASSEGSNGQEGTSFTVDMKFSSEQQGKLEQGSLEVDMKFSSEQQGKLEQGSLDANACIFELFNPSSDKTVVKTRQVKGSISGKTLKYCLDNPKERKIYNLHRGANERIAYLNSKL